MHEKDGKLINFDQFEKAKRKALFNLSPKRYFSIVNLPIIFPATQILRDVLYERGFTEYGLWSVIVYSVWVGLSILVYFLIYKKTTRNIRKSLAEITYEDYLIVYAKKQGEKVED